MVALFLIDWDTTLLPDDIDAACGQLRATTVSLSSKSSAKLAD